MKNNTINMPKDYNEVNQIIDNAIQNLTRLKNGLNENKDNVKKLYEIIDAIDNLQGDLALVKIFIMDQIYSNSGYNDG
jgi:hypothetical protein